MRCPRMHGLPPQTCGSMLIRWRISCRFIVRLLHAVSSTLFVVLLIIARIVVHVHIPLAEATGRVYNAPHGVFGTATSTAHRAAARRFKGGAKLCQLFGQLLRNFNECDRLGGTSDSG